VHTPELRDLLDDPRPRSSARERVWTGYAVSVASVGLVSAAGFYMQHHMARTNLAMLYLLTVVVGALWFGRGPAIFSAVSGSLIFGRLFMPPFWTAGLDDVWYLITFVTLLAVGLLISTLTSHAREETRKARNRERYTAALYSLNRSLADAGQLNGILEAIERHINETFRQPVAVLLRDGDELPVSFHSPGFELEEAGHAAAAASLRQACDAVSSPADSRRTGVCLLPLRTGRGVLGVLVIKAGDAPEGLSSEQWQLLEGFVSQAASAIERALLAEEARRAQLLQEANKMQRALLSSISHNLRTPLASITGALSSLLEDQAVRDASTERELLETALGESERLNRVVGNLLDMTRLEAGAVGVKRELSDVQDVLGTAFEHLGGATRGREIRVHIEPNLPLVEMDSLLIAQVLVNLIDNALKYSPADQAVDVRARVAGGSLEIQVEDRGIGIAPADLEHIFERFYRAPRAGGVSGMGLGLSISRRFVEAHGGSIRATSVEHEGTTMTFLVPLAAERGEAKGADVRTRTAYSGR
jgi:two-component system sensor histidine kinase KdpD